MVIKHSNRIVSVLFTEDQLRGLKLAAFTEDRSMSKYVGRIVIEHLLEKGFITPEEARGFQPIEE